MAIGTMAALAGGAALSGATSGLFGWLGNRQQIRAAEEASALARDYAEGTQGRNEQIAQGQFGALDAGQQQALAHLVEGYSGAEGAYGQANASALAALMGGYNQARQDVAGYNQAAMGTLAGAQGNLAALYGQGAGALQQGYGQAAGLSRYGSVADNPYQVSMAGVQGPRGYNAAMVQAPGAYRAGDVMGTRSRLGELYDQGVGLKDVQLDPGYEFRQKQGEDALMRAASARGGRGGARTMQELMQFNQGLASEEYGRAAQRQMADTAQRIGAASGADQFGAQLALNQAGRQDSALAQALGYQSQAGLANAAAQNQASAMASQQGYGATMDLAARQDAARAMQAQQQYGLAGLGYQAQGQLGQSLAGLYGNQAAAGNALSSQMAGYQAGAGNTLAGLASQQGSNAANLWGQWGQQQGGLEQAYGNQMANLYGANAANVSNVYGNLIGTNTSLGQSAMGTAGMAVPYAGSQWAALGQGINQGIGNGMFLAGMYGGQPTSGGNGGYTTYYGPTVGQGGQDWH